MIFLSTSSNNSSQRLPSISQIPDEFRIFFGYGKSQKHDFLLDYGPPWFVLLKGFG